MAVHNRFICIQNAIFWGLDKWPPIGGWLLIRVAAHNRFYCMVKLAKCNFSQIDFENIVYFEQFCGVISANMIYSYFGHATNDI